jgi:hypothetical protein
MQIFSSARSESQSVKELFTEKMSTSNPGIKSVLVQSGVLGDSTLFIAICYTPKSEWANGIFENSNYVRFMISNDGTVEPHVTSLYAQGANISYESRLPIKKFRKTKAKSIQDAINKITNWSLAVETFYK